MSPPIMQTGRLKKSLNMFRILCPKSPLPCGIHLILDGQNLLFLTKKSGLKEMIMSHLGSFKFLIVFLSWCRNHQAATVDPTSLANLVLTLPGKGSFAIITRQALGFLKICLENPIVNFFQLINLLCFNLFINSMHCFSN